MKEIVTMRAECLQKSNRAAEASSHKTHFHADTNRAKRMEYAAFHTLLGAPASLPARSARSQRARRDIGAPRFSSSAANAVHGYLHRSLLKMPFFILALFLTAGTAFAAEDTTWSFGVAQ